jgi:hypothetical protein
MEVKIWVSEQLIFDSALGKMKVGKYFKKNIISKKPFGDMTILIGDKKWERKINYQIQKYWIIDIMQVDDLFKGENDCELIIEIMDFKEIPRLE